MDKILSVMAVILFIVSIASVLGLLIVVFFRKWKEDDEGYKNFCIEIMSFSCLTICLFISSAVTLLFAHFGLK